MTEEENYRNFINHVFRYNYEKQITSELKEMIISLINSTTSVRDQPTRTVIALKMRFGLPPYSSKHTYKLIGEKFNKSKERIRQTLEKSYRQMRHISRSQEIRNYLGNIYD